MTLLLPVRLSLRVVVVVVVVVPTVGAVVCTRSRRGSCGLVGCKLFGWLVGLVGAGGGGGGGGVTKGAWPRFTLRKF